MINQDFFEHLEFELTKALSNSKNPETKGFWCDGILLPNNENEYSKKTINDKRLLNLKAFMGKSGQEEYNMMLHFGKKSLSKIQRDLDIKLCLPNLDSDEWIKIDTANKEIVIKLD